MNFNVLQNTLKINNLLYENFMENRSIIIVSAESALSRLDNFLASSFPDHSRTYFQDLIKKGHIEVNGTLTTKSSTHLKEYDKVSCLFPPPPLSKVEPVDVAFEVVDKNEDFLIINKPEGLLVHPTTTLPYDPSLVAGLLYRFDEFKKFDSNERPGIVHRLDKNTSGLLIVANSPQSQATFSALFKERSVKKVYLALVEGHPPKSGKINFPIGRDPRNPSKMSHKGVAPREALSYYRVIKYYKEHALLEVRIVTGRTHQIRVHCAAIGHPIIGDEVYGKSSPLIKRQALHAWKISFTYKNRDYAYCKCIPEDFKRLLFRINSN